MADIFLNILEIAGISAIITVILLFFEKIILKRFSPKLYYFAWLILALRMLLPFSLPQIETPVSVTIPNRTVSVSESIPEEIEYFDSVPQTPVDKSDMVVVIPEEPFVFYPIEPVPEKSTSVVWTSDIIANIWLTGVAIVALYYVLQYAVFRIRLNKRTPVFDSNILFVFDDVCSEMNVKNASLCYWSDARGPMLVGYFRPIVVLPFDMELDDQTLRFIFTHELSHFRRRDLWYKLLMSAVTAIYWFDSFAWIMRKCSYKSVELSCDSDVVKNKTTEYRGLYSKAILSGVALKHCASQGYTTYFANDKRLLKERFSFILDTSAKKLGITVLSIVIIASIVVSSVVACDFYEPGKPIEIENEDLTEDPEDIPNASIDAVLEASPLTAFSIVCDTDSNYSIAGIFENGNVEELFGFGKEAVLDIDIDNGRLYVLLADEIGYIDLAADKPEYTHLFYSDSHEGYNSFYRFAVHKGYIYLLYGVYDVGDVFIDRIPITAQSIKEVERYQDCMLMDDIYIDKEKDLLYYYVIETNGISSEEIASVYARDMKTNLSNCILSDMDMFRYFDGDIASPTLVKDYLVYTFNKDGGGTYLCLLNLSTSKQSVISIDIKSYAISGKYVYYIDSEGALSALDLEKDAIVDFTFPHQFEQEEIIIEPFGLEQVLVWALTFNDDWMVQDSVYQIIDSNGNIYESNNYISSSYPVYITESILSSGPSDMIIEDRPVSFDEKRFMELFENIASYIGKGIFDGNSMTDEDKFFLAYFLGECDGSNSEYGDIYPIDYIQNLLETHISEYYASRFEPKNVPFYNSATTTFTFPSDLKQVFSAKAETSGYDGILNVYKYSSDGNNLERIYITSLSVYSSGIGETSWKINSYYEKLTETSSDLDDVGKYLFDIAVMSYGDTYKDFEYSTIVLDDNKTIVVGYGGWYIGFEIFFGENGLGVMSAELVDPDEYMIKPKPEIIEPATDEVYDVDIEQLFSKLHLYQKFAEYSSDSMEIDINSVDESGLYYKVTDENYDTWSEWISFVESIFCGEYLESAKNNDLYINVDGYTYCRPGSMGWYLSEVYSYSIIENKISEVVISVSYEELSPTATETTTYQTFTYVLKNTDNGWRVSGRISK